MRILSIITTFATGGAERLVVQLSAHFSALGCESTVMAMSDAAALGNDAAYEQLMMAELRDAGSAACHLGTRQRRNLVAAIWAMRKHLRTINPDLIHAHSAWALLVSVLSRPGVPVIYTHHNIRLTFPPALFHIFRRTVDAYIAISPQCRSLLEERGCAPITDIQNGIKLETRRFSRDAPHDPVRLISVGNVTPQKDFGTLRAAVKLLSEQDPPLPVSCQIAGGGAGLSAFKAQIDEGGENDRIALLGSRPDVADLLGEADIYVNSSLWEGLPLALIEAGAAQLPIIATHVGGNPMVCHDGLNGRLVEPGNAQAIADAVREIVASPTAYAAMAAQSREIAERFSIEECGKAHVALYQRLLNRA